MSDLKNARENRVDQLTFNQLFSTNPSLPIASMLMNHGYSTTIDGIHIASNGTSNDFSGCTFKDVSFSGYFHNASFNATTFEHVKIDHVNFEKSSFLDARFYQSEIKDSSFQNSYFKNAEFYVDKIQGCDFSQSHLEDIHLNKTVISNSDFKNASHINNTSSESHMVFTQKYQLNDYAFQNTHTHLIKPTIALVTDSVWFNGPYNIILKYGGTPVAIGQTNSSIDNMSLNMEVQAALKEIKEHGLTASSIAEQVINTDTPLIQQIKSHAYDVVKSAEAVWIPGGLDLHPEFYNEENYHSYSGRNYYREILEFSLTQAAINMEKPILGVCHGSQLVNVYLGGSLHQHVDTEAGYVTLKTHTQEGLIGSVIKDNLIGPSYHHQAVKDLAPNLEVVASYHDVIKATQSSDDKKIMLCQFHPEYEADESSENILSQFINLSSESKVTSKVMELTDVIQKNDDVLELYFNHDSSNQSTDISEYVINFFSSTLNDFLVQFIEPLMLDI